MASIPCAAYQASHIHAHIRRQNAARKRHLSSTSSESSDLPALDITAAAINSQSAASSPVPSTPPISPLVTAEQSQHGGVWGGMDRVSSWVTDHIGFKKWTTSPFVFPQSEKHTTATQDKSVYMIAMVTELGSTSRVSFFRTLPPPANPTIATSDSQPQPTTGNMVKS